MTHYIPINGFHVGIPAATNGLGDYLNWMAANDVPFLAKAVDNTSGLVDAQNLLANGARGHTIYRKSQGYPGQNDDVPRYGSDVNQEADRFWNTYRDTFPPELTPGLTWAELINEVDKNHADWIGHFCVALAQRANRDGFKFCGPGWSAGEPEHWETPGMLAFLRYCASNPDRCAVAIHEYSYSPDMSVDGWLIGRFRFIHDTCDKYRIPRPTTFITEWGWEYRSVPVDSLESDIITVGSHYAQYDNIKGAAIWALDTGSNWSNLGDVVNGQLVQGQRLAHILKDNPQPDPEPPPTPEPGELKNGSFEMDWTDVQPAPDRLQEPSHWQLVVLTPGQQSWATNRATGEKPIITNVPECIHKKAWQLPPDEQPGGPDALILDGQTTYKIQGVNMVVGVQLNQTITGLEPGRYLINVPARVHYHPPDTQDREPPLEPDDVELWILIDGLLKVARWQKDLPHREWVYIPVEFDSAGQTELGIWWANKWGNSRDLIIDNITIKGIDDMPKHTAIVVKAPQEVTPDEWQRLADYSYEFRHTMTASHDDTITVLEAGNNTSYAKIYKPELPSQAQTIQELEDRGLNWESLSLPGDNRPFEFTAWPTSQRIVTQRWAARPEYYSQFGLPGHEGIDLAAPTNSPVFAVADGIVTAVKADDGNHNYGTFIRIDHWDDYQTTYAHLARFDVLVGQKVTAGQIVGYADSTGNASGSHLHLTLKRLGYTYTDEHGTWPHFIHDPTPFIEPFNPAWPPPVNKTDLLPYFAPTANYGPMYEVRHPSGATETFQMQWDQNLFYQVKNSQYEQFTADDNFIYRGLDTSPGPAPDYAERPGQLRYYRQFDPGQGFAKWCPRFMRLGEEWIGYGHQVQFYYKSDCIPSSANSGGATNRIKWVAYHNRKTWNGITVDDIIEMTNGTETWFFAREMGLVAWRSAWGESAISELHEGRPNLTRETGCW